jgi:hypothetical protein
MGLKILNRGQLLKDAVFRKKEKEMLSLYRQWRPLWLLRLRLPHFQIFGSQMAARLSALCAGRFLPPGKYLVLIFVRG